MAPPRKFEWTEKKRADLLECFENAQVMVQRHPNKARFGVMFVNLFLKCHPECSLKESSLIVWVHRFRNGDALPLATPPSILWNDERNLFLAKCAQDAVAENNKRKSLGLYQGKSGKQGGFENIMTALFQTKFPEFRKQQIVSQLLRLRREGTFTDDIWTDAQNDCLVHCIYDAFAECKLLWTNEQLAAATAKRIHFENLIVENFQTIFPESSKNQILFHYNGLRTEGRFEDISKDLPSDTSADDYNRIEKYWEKGFQHSKKPLFFATCCRCSKLLSRTHQRQKTITVSNEDEYNALPIVRHYPESAILNAPPIMSDKKSKRDRHFFICDTCHADVSLLDTFSLTDAPAAPEKFLPFPERLVGLNAPEKGMTGLVALLSQTLRRSDKQRGIYEHKAGEINALHKKDEAYFDLHARMLEKPVRNERYTSSKVVGAIRWLKKFNWLFMLFFATYETLFRWKDKEEGEPQSISCFGNTTIRPQKKTTMADILGEEERGVLIPAYDMPGRGKHLNEMITAIQHIQKWPNEKESFNKAMALHYGFAKVQYGSQFLKEKIWPYLFPWGVGGYYRPTSKGVSKGSYVKWRLLMLWHNFRRESTFIFFMLDHLIKEKLSYFAYALVNVTNLARDLTSHDVQPTAYDPYSQFGTEVPSETPGSRQYWRARCRELTALAVSKGREPDYFITLTQYDQWPELMAVLGNKVNGKWIPKMRKGLEKLQEQVDTGELPEWDPNTRKEFSDYLKRGESPVDYPVEMVMTFFSRLQLFMNSFVLNDNDVLGVVEDYWYRVEFQKRGGLHVHMVVWCKSGTHDPNKVITAEMPRFNHPHNSVWRDLVTKTQKHVCRPDRCFRGPKGTFLKKCKYGFMFLLCKILRLDSTGIRYLYPRSEVEDADVATYNLEMLLLWGGHVNIQRVTSNGWIMYLCKYIAKSDAPQSVEIINRATPPASTKNLRVKKSSSDPTPVTKVQAPLECEEAGDLVPLPVVDDVSADFDQSAGRLQSKVPSPRDAPNDTNVKAFLKTRVVSSLEACTILLGKAMVKCSREFIFLPIDLQPKNRVLKRAAHLKDLPPDSKEIYYDTKLQKYLGRPAELKDVTYPEYFSKYYIRFGKAKRGDLQPDQDPDDEDCDESVEYDVNEPMMKKMKHLQDKSGRTVLERKKLAKYAITYFHNYRPWGDQMEMYCLAKLLQVVPVDDVTIRELAEPCYLQQCLDRGLIKEEQEALNFLEHSAKTGVSVSGLTYMAQQLMQGGWLAHQDIDTLLETVAPYHQKIEAQLLAEVTDEDHELEGGLNYRNELPLEHFTDNFTPSQAGAFNWITERWSKGKVVRALITGGAGVGKSFLMSALSQWCLENGQKVLRCATTGNAGCLIGGTTIHYRLKFDYDLKSWLQKGTFAEKLIRETNVLFIDEVSMMDALLWTRLNEELQHVTGNGSLFGGKSVILFGDPAQLPPVGPHIWTPWHFGNWFSVLVLRENKRQENQEFVAMLNRFRQGDQTKDDFAQLSKRIISLDDIKALDLSKGAVLYGTREMRNRFNATELAQLAVQPGQSRIYEAIDTDAAGEKIPEKSATANHYLTQEKNEKILPKLIELKVGAKVLLIRNIDVLNGWVNGRMATIESLSDNYIVLAAVDNLNQKFTLVRLKMEVPWKEKGNLYYREQFPLILGYAMTVHKAQGTTLAIVVIDAQGFRGSGQGYTAISRGKRLEDLYFLRLDPDSFFISAGYKKLLDWMDKVDVLSGFSENGRKPKMPPVEYQQKPVDKKGPFHAVADKHLENLPKECLKPHAIPRLTITNQNGTIVDAEEADVEQSIVSPVRVLLDSIIKVCNESSVDEFLPTLQQIATSNNALITGIRNEISDADHRFYNPLLHADDVDTGSCLRFYKVTQKHLLAMITAQDGNGLFRALSWTLYGEQEGHLKLRLLCCYIFVEYWSTFENQFSTLTASRDLRTVILDTAECYNVSKPSTCGDGAHLAAIAIAARRPVFVYEAFSVEDAHDFNDFDLDKAQGHILYGTHPGVQHFAFFPLQSSAQSTKRPLCLLSTDRETNQFCGMLQKQNGYVFRVEKRGSFIRAERAKAAIIPDTDTCMSENVSRSEQPMPALKVVNEVEPLMTAQTLSRVLCFPSRKNLRHELSAAQLGHLSAIPFQHAKQFGMYQPWCASVPGFLTIQETEMLLNAIRALSVPPPSHQNRIVTPTYLEQIDDILHPHQLKLTRFRTAVFQSRRPKYCPAVHDYWEDDKEPRKIYKRMTKDYAFMWTEGEGHCMFHAVSWSLFGHQDFHEHLRLLALQILCEHHAYFGVMAGFPFHNNEPHTIIRNTASIRPPIGWGDSIHLKALAIAAGRKIYNYRQLKPTAEECLAFHAYSLEQVMDHVKSEDWRMQGHTSYWSFQAEEVDEPEPVCIFYVNNNHYEGMIPRTSHAPVYAVARRADIPPDPDTPRTVHPGVTQIE